MWRSYGGAESALGYAVVAVARDQSPLSFCVRGRAAGTQAAARLVSARSVPPPRGQQRNAKRHDGCQMTCSMSWDRDMSRLSHHVGSNLEIDTLLRRRRLDPSHSSCRFRRSGLQAAGHGAVLCVAGLVAAGCHEGAEYPAGRVGPGGAEGGPGPVDQPGAVLRYRHVVGAQSVMKVRLPAVFSSLNGPGSSGTLIAFMSRTSRSRSGEPGE